MTIRPVIFSDIPAVAELERHIFSPPYSQAALEQELAVPDAVFFAAEEEGRIIGYALLRCLGDEAELYRVAVSPEVRRRGIASLLLREGIEKCRERGAETIWLEVRSGNEPARALYRRFGFTEAYIRKNYYSDPQEDAVVMSLALPRQSEETPC